MKVAFPDASYKYEEELITKEEFYLENIGLFNREIKQVEDNVR